MRMREKILQILFFMLLGVLLWRGLAWLLLPGMHEHIDKYYQESETFEETHNMSRIDYMQWTRYDLERVLKSLGLEPTPPPAKHEDEGRTTSGK